MRVEHDRAREAYEVGLVLYREQKCGAVFDIDSLTDQPVQPPGQGIDCIVCVGGVWVVQRRGVGARP